MPKPGDVYFHSQFKYQNGSIGRKLLIVLNKKERKSLCLSLKTTSQNERYKGAQKGCNPDKKVFFIPKEWQRFDVPTYVQLVPIYPIQLEELIRLGMYKVIEYKFTLTDDCLKQLLNCLKKHFRKDISDYFYQLIFK